MQKIYLTAAIVIISLAASAQQLGVWSTPVPQTDSSAVNQDAFVISTYTQSDKYLQMFYVKKETPGSPPQIWYKTISESSATENQLLSDEEVSFRNPRAIITDNYANPRYFLIYESNEIGFFNLYGMEFNAEASWFGASFQLTSFTTQIEEMNTSTQWYNDNSQICWTTDDGLASARLVQSSDTLILQNLQDISFNHCSNPVIASEFIAWIDEENDNYSFSSNYNYSNQSWETPDSIPGTKNTLALSLGNSLYGFSERALIIEKADSVMYYNFQNEDFVWPFYYTDPPEPILQASAFTFELLLDFFPMVFTFVSNADGYYNVYGYSDLYWEFEQLTFDTIPKQNPDLYFGRSYSYWFEVINVWEKVFDEGTALYTSTILQTIGGIDEEWGNEGSISVSPNPFTKECIIKKATNSAAQKAVVYDITGRKVTELNPVILGNEQFEYKWQAAGMDVQHGIYFLKAGNEIVKLIYSE